MKKFEDLTFADHYMFEKVLQNKEICKELLERLLKIKIERLEYPEIEKEISPYFTKCDEIGNLTLEDKMIKKMFNAKVYSKESDMSTLFNNNRYSFV